MTLSQVPGRRSTGQAAAKGPVPCCVFWCGSGPDSDAFGLCAFSWLFQADSRFLVRQREALVCVFSLGKGSWAALKEPPLLPFLLTC